MLEIILTLFLSLAANTPEGQIESCELSSKSLCCTWQYEEVGCYHYFDVREEWCLKINGRHLSWEFKESLVEYEDNDDYDDSVDRLH